MDCGMPGGKSRWPGPATPAVARAGATRRYSCHTMMRRILVVTLLLLLSFIAVAQLRLARRPAPQRAAPVASADTDLTLDRRGDHRTRAPLDLAGALIPPLDSVSRLTARVRLTTEPERHYLDSLLTGADSTIRRWPTDAGILGVAITPGAGPGFVADMVHDVRWALDAWSPVGIGLRFVEVADTGEAVLRVRWTDTLEGDRAGVTDVTWDRAGRIKHADVTLATRSPTTGRPLTLEARRAVALHELGHVLGLPHSALSSDVMFPIATALVPTERDRFSLRLLYQLPAGWVGAQQPGAAP